MIGLEIVLPSDGNRQIHALSLKKSKGALQISERESAVDLESLSFSKQHPVVVGICGKGVLERVFETKSTSLLSERDVLGVLLPNANESDFYIQWHQVNKQVFAAAIRRDVARDLIKDIQSVGLEVIGLCLGSATVSQLKPVLAPSDIQFAAHGQLFTFQDDHLINVSKVENSPSGQLTIGDDLIEDKYALSYAMAFQELLPINKIAVLAPEFETAREESIQKKRFKLTSVAAMAVIFFGLIGNYMAFSTYHNENSELQGQANLNTAIVKQCDSLETKLKEKERFLTQERWLKQSRMSYYSDQVAQSVPRTMKLRNLTVNPLDMVESRKARKQVFQSGTILISGTCAKVTDLNPWIVELKNLDWSGEVNMVDYQYDPKRRLGDFTLEIIL